MSLRNEQCNKVCRILDDVLANRPTERDSLITAVRKAFGALETEPQWIPCSERLPEADERVLVTTGSYDYYVWDCMSNRSDNYFWEDESGFYHDKHEVIAWMPLPSPYRAERREK